MAAGVLRTAAAHCIPRPTNKGLPYEKEEKKRKAFGGAWWRPPWVAPSCQRSLDLEKKHNNAIASGFRAWSLARCARGGCRSRFRNVAHVSAPWIGFLTGHIAVDCFFVRRQRQTFVCKPSTRVSAVIRCNTFASPQYSNVVAFPCDLFRSIFLLEERGNLLWETQMGKPSTRGNAVKVKFSWVQHAVLPPALHSRASCSAESVVTSLWELQPAVGDGC